MSILRSAGGIKMVGLLMMAALGACQMDDGDADPGERRGEGEQALCLAVDPARSLAVTDPSILAHFPLQGVLARIIADAGVGPTPLALYQQWWDTQNDERSAVHAAGPHCAGTINGHPVDCPRQEGMLAATNPFVPGPDAFVPLALFNRFDLAPADGAHCGEYGVVYGKQSGTTSATDRGFIIFEAVLPNPSPSAGLGACKPVADFWAQLSTVQSAATRGSQLRSFYFDGLPGFAPVLRWDHYAGSAAGSGQIRTSQFMPARSYFGGRPLGQPWALRAFRAEIACAGSCKLLFLPEGVAGSPEPSLFDPGASAAFQADFVANQVAPLAASSLTGIALSTPASFDAGQSVAIPSSSYAAHATGAAFASAVQSKLDALGSPLSADDIFERATTQTCGGCHQLSSGSDLGGGMIWPASLGFVHVSEARALSPALTGTFLPARKAILEDCVCGRTCP